MHALTRWCGLALLLLPGWCLAQACPEADGYDQHTTQAAAYQHAVTCSAQYTGANITGQTVVEYDPGTGDPTWREKAQRVDNGAILWNGRHGYPRAQKCIAPMVWDAPSLSCVNATERCKAKNAIVPDTSTLTGAFGTCVDGCMIGEREPSTVGKVDVDTTSIRFGKIGFTGETCSGGGLELPNFDTGKTCVPAAGGGMTVCVTPDGRHCYSTKTTVVTLDNDAVCWQPGETGTKSKGPVTQTRGPGTNPPTSPPPPDGESHTPGPGNPTTTTTQKPGQPGSITTTTTNVTNVNGTNGPNQQTGDGSGDDGKEGKNGLTGSGDCESGGYTATGDPVLGAILDEAWFDRCAGEGDGKANEENAGTLGDAADGMEPGEGEGIITDNPVGAGVNDTWFSFGGATCPTLPSVTIPGTEYTFAAPPEFCEAVAALGLLFQLIAGVWALRIVGS